MEETEENGTINLLLPNVDDCEDNSNSSKEEKDSDTIYVDYISSYLNL